MLGMLGTKNTFDRLWGLPSAVRADNEDVIYVIAYKGLPSWTSSVSSPPSALIP